MSTEDELREELTRLRITVTRRLRERLEDPTAMATPAYLEAARKFLTDQGMVLPPKRAQRAPPVTIDLPFQDPE